MRQKEGDAKQGGKEGGQDETHLRRGHEVLREEFNLVIVAVKNHIHCLEHGLEARYTRFVVGAHQLEGALEGRDFLDLREGGQEGGKEGGREGMGEL